MTARSVVGINTPDAAGMGTSEPPDETATGVGTRALRAPGDSLRPRGNADVVVRARNPTPAPVPVVGIGIGIGIPPIGAAPARVRPANEADVRNDAHARPTARSTGRP